MTGLKSRLKRLVQDQLRRLPQNREIDALYSVLYDAVHDLDQSHGVRPFSTGETFSTQWQEYPQGDYLLSDPWFRENVQRVLCEQEILLKPEWFRGKRVLDAGCGNGRWAYGFCKLGADLTCVDQSAAGLRQTENAIAEFDNPRRLVQTPLEELTGALDATAGYDLVFSWGVLHHCNSFTRAFDNVAAAVRDGGVVYLYLYGRELLSLRDDIELFKRRVAYNALFDASQREAFLRRMARGDRNLINSQHDLYAPLINRRFEFDAVKKLLEARGFTGVTRTVAHPEIFVRAVKGQRDLGPFLLPPKSPPFWFEGHHL